jgi:hypothetical protein
MTTIITRLYADKATADAVAGALAGEGFPASIINVIPAADDPAAHIRAAGVRKGSVAAVAEKLTGSRALLVVRAPFSPIGAARRAMEIVDATESIHIAGVDQNDYVESNPDPRLSLSVLTDHPRFFSMDIVPGSGIRTGLISDAFGIRLLSSRRKRDSAMRGGGFMSTKLLPFPLLIRGRRSTSAIRGGWSLSSALGWSTVAKKR